LDRRLSHVPIDRTKLNLKGGSVALGHPFGATGARIVATLAKQLAERGSGRRLISICTAGGMGVTAILERSFIRGMVRVCIIRPSQGGQ
jgi:acetyl-CoA acetyltransferase